MDALLLMASMVTAMGFEGTGDFQMDAGRTALACAGKAPVAVRLSGRADRPSAPVRRRAQGGIVLDEPLWDIAIENGRLYGIRLDGVWMHVGTPEAVREADAFLADLVPGLSATANVLTIAASLPFAETLRARADRAAGRRARSARACRRRRSICRRGARRAASAIPSRACWAARRCCRTSSRSAMSTRTNSCSMPMPAISILPPAIAPIRRSCCSPR